MISPMSFADISSADAVVEAIRECQRLGEATFLQKYHYGPTRHVRLFYAGSDYPAKAILGVAHGCQFPDLGPLSPKDFSSEDSTISKFRQLRFEARSISDVDAARLFVVRGGSDEE